MTLMEYKRKPVLVGHPLNALDREIKRLVVREQLEKEQHKIIKEDGINSKQVKGKLLQLYELYETFRGDDNSCLSGTDTKQNLYKLYTDIFNSKRPVTGSGSPRRDFPKRDSPTKILKERIRPFTAAPLRTTTRTRNQTFNSASAPSTFPRNTHDSAPRQAPASPNLSSPLHNTMNPRSPPRHSRTRPHSAPANFHYNNLYTANRCYTARRTCEKCNEHCNCVICTPLLEAKGSRWRDITCAVTPDQTQIEARWEEMSPRIQAQLLHPVQQPVTTRKRKTTAKKTKEKKVAPEDMRSTGSRDERKSTASRTGARPNKPQQAWTAAATPSSKTAAQTPKSPNKKREQSPAKQQAPREKVQRQRPQHRYQRENKTDKKYRWDKADSESETSGEEEGEKDDILERIENMPTDEDVIHSGRILRERRRHKWGDYQAVLTSRALYMYNREYDHRPKEILPLWGTTMSINADRTDLQFSFILKTTSTQKNKAMYKMSCLTGDEMKVWLTKLKQAMKMNMDIATEIARTKKPSALGEMAENPSWSHEGYRVDVSYISDNILVCSFPPTKSDVYELKRFMDDKHRGNYRIVNVAETSYDEAMFQGSVSSYPTPAEGVCPLTSLWQFCVFVETWLKEDDSNVILVHCPTGIMPSGLFIGAYLVHSRICWTSEQAAKQFQTKRQGAVISLPCHIRYLKYIETSVIAGDTPEDIKLLFSKMTLSNAPAFNEDGSCKPYFVVYQNGEQIYEFESPESYKSEEAISFPVSLQISGDIKIQFYSVSDILGTQEMFTIYFHTFYISTSHVRFSREMIDGAHLNTFKQFTDTFSVTLEVK